jgi:hypothetical protein
LRVDLADQMTLVFRSRPRTARRAGCGVVMFLCREPLQDLARLAQARLACAQYQVAVRLDRSHCLQALPSWRPRFQQ